MVFVHLIPLLLLASSTVSNPVPIDRFLPLDSSPDIDDVGILERNAPTTESTSSHEIPSQEKLSCDNTGAERCLLFPIGCIPSNNCSDRLLINKIKSGTNEGDIIIELNLHVARVNHMLVAVPMPSATNPNSSFLIGCSIDAAQAVVAHPDVDGVTEMIPMSWLRLVAVSATSEDLLCIVSVSPGHVSLPSGDIAVFAGGLDEEEQAVVARIAGHMDESELAPVVGIERREEAFERSDDKVEHRSPTEKHHITEPTTVIEEEDSAHEDAVEEENSSTTVRSTTTTTEEARRLSKPNKLRLKLIHQSKEQEERTVEETGQPLAPRHRHPDHHIVHHDAVPPSHHRADDVSHHAVHHDDTHHHRAADVSHLSHSTTTSSEPLKKSSEELPAFVQDQASEEEEEEEPETTTVHHKVDHHHSVRLVPTSTTTTTTHKSRSFEDDPDLSERQKEMIRSLEEGRTRHEHDEKDEEEEEENEEDSHGGKVTTYNLDRSTARDADHSHNDHKEHHNEHSDRHRAHKEEKEENDDDDEDEEEKEKEKKRVPDMDTDEDEDEPDSASMVSLLMPLFVILPFV